MSPLILLGCLLASAAAEDLILYEGTDPASALLEVQRRGAVVGDDVRIAVWSAVAQGGVPWVRGALGVVESCADSGPVELGMRLREIEGLVRFSEFDKARLEIMEAERRLPCASLDIEGKALSRLYLLDGYVGWASGDAARAEAGFRQWLAIDPLAAWDSRFPPAAAAAAERLRPEAIRSSRLSFDPPVATVVIDGREVSPPPDGIPLPAGLHLVQVRGAPTLRVQFAPGATVTVAVLGAYPSDILLGLATEEGRGTVTSLIAALPRPVRWVVLGADVYVQIGGKWRLLPVDVPAGEAVKVRR